MRANAGLDDGVVMLVELFANDSLVENLNPVGRMYYAALDAGVHAVIA